MGFSRDTFYRYQAARDAGGVEVLFEASRGKPNLKSRVEDGERKHILRVLDMAEQQIAGQGGAAEMLGVNPSTLRCA